MRKIARSSAFCILAAFATMTMAADEVSWNADGAGNLPPQQWYSYTYPETNSGVTVKFTEPDAEDVPYVVSATFSAKSGAKSDNSAGFGFAWKVNSNYEPTIYSGVSNHKGICISYSSNATIRMDLKQFNIEDSDYYGTNLSSTSGALKSMYVSFDDVEQAWDDKKGYAFLVRQLMGVQFSCKASAITKLGSDVKFTVSALTLADECPSFAPNLKSPYSDYDGKVLELKEGEENVVPFADVFEDKDGDELSIEFSVTGSGVAVVSSTKDAYNLSDVLKIAAVANPKSTDSAVVKITATDATNKSVTLTYGIKPIDTFNAPVARDTSFEVDEGKVLSQPRFNIYTLATDADGDDISIEIEDLTTHGSLNFDEDRGSFTYTPDDGFYGEDFFTYKAYETDHDTSFAIGKVTINVNHINVAPKVTIVDSNFAYYGYDGEMMYAEIGDTLTLDEDFDTLWVEFNSKDVVFTDDDGPTLDVGAKASGILNAEYSLVGKNIYCIALTSIADANGVAKVTLYATDGQYDNNEVYFYVDVNPVADPPKAIDDKYDAKEDTKLTVSAAKGVLANDVNPDDAKVSLTAVLKTDAKHGKVTLKADGSFTYMPEEDFFGDDSFTYVAANKTDTSKAATVTIAVADMPEPPRLAVKESSLDTTVKEDASAIVYTERVLTTWIKTESTEKLTFVFENDDDKLTVKKNGTAWWVQLVKDAYGEASVTVKVSDGVSDTLSFKIHVFITPVQDAPRVIAKDTFEVKNSGWKVSVALDSIFKDVDGDTLTYKAIREVSFNTEIKDGRFYVSPATDSTVIKDGKYNIRVRAYDATDSATATVLVIVGTGDSKKTSLNSIAVAPASWQSAILASRGTVSIMDMQGRVMWNAKLPVSETSVRNAAARVQGRKILRVNRETWTIK